MSTWGEMISETKESDFIEAWMIVGTPMLTIKGVEKCKVPRSKMPKPTIIFEGTRRKLVIPKITIFCLKQMFGERREDSYGKRIVLRKGTTRLGATTVECVRLWGSPDITKDIVIDKQMGGEHVNMVLRAGRPEKDGELMTAADVKPTATPAQVDPAILESWSALGWSREQGLKHMEEHGDGDYAGHLNSLIDEMNAKEGAF